MLFSYILKFPARLYYILKIYLAFKARKQEFTGQKESRMFWMKNRISYDSFIRIIFICALIALPINMLLAFHLNAEPNEFALLKQPHVDVTKKESKKPGDAEDVGGKKEINEFYNGNGNYNTPLRSSINPVRKEFIIRYCIIYMLCIFF